MKWISSVRNEQFKVGSVDDEIISDARKAGLSEAGIEALTNGNRAAYKRELDALQRSNPGSIWACTSGYCLWFNAAPEVERETDYHKLERELDQIADKTTGKLLICLRCGHSWKTREPGNPKVCPNPKCKSPYWDKPRKK